MNDYIHNKKNLVEVFALTYQQQLLENKYTLWYDQASWKILSLFFTFKQTVYI